MTVEVQIITIEPKIPFEETDAIKARLREFTEQINSGKFEFSTLARMYSEDPGSAARGGELGFMSKTQLLPEFANVAFNLKDLQHVWTLSIRILWIRNSLLKKQLLSFLTTKILVITRV